MDRIGYVDKTTLILALTNNENRVELENSEVNKKLSQGFSNSLSKIKSLEKTGNLVKLLESEYAFVIGDEAYAKSMDPLAVKSHAAAREDFETIFRSLSIVDSPELYAAVNATTRANDRTRTGLPVDGFHRAIKSHITRLGNQVRTVGLSHAQKDLLIQRQQNMHLAKDFYMELQAKALGMEPSVKDKESER